MLNERDEDVPSILQSSRNLRDAEVDDENTRNTDVRTWNKKSGLKATRRVFDELLETAQSSSR